MFELEHQLAEAAPRPQTRCNQSRAEGYSSSNIIAGSPPPERAERAIWGRPPARSAEREDGRGGGTLTLESTGIRRYTSFDYDRV